MSSDKSPWKLLGAQVVYKNPWFEVRKDKVIRPDGTPGEYNVVEVPDSVFIVALDDDQQVLMVKLYRYPTQEYSIEVPAGGAEGQDLFEAAERELQEETGMQAKNWQKIGFIHPANGYVNETCHIFLATGLSPVGNHEQGLEGISAVMKVPFAKVLAMVKSGELTDSQSITAILMAAVHINILDIKKEKDNEGTATQREPQNIIV